MRAAHLKDIQPLQDQMLSKSKEMRSLWQATTPDKEKIIALQKEAEGLRDQLTDKITTYRLDVRQVLTPEQQAKVQAYGTGRGMAPARKTWPPAAMAATTRWRITST